MKAAFCTCLGLILYTLSGFLIFPTVVRLVAVNQLRLCLGLAGHPAG